MAAQMEATPAFMSPAPRPYMRPPRMAGSKGGVVQRSAAPSGTTSIWPCSRSERPAAARGRWIAATLSRPA